MPSNFPTQLKTLIASGWCKSYPGLKLIFKDGSEVNYSTIDITASGITFVNRLSRVGTLKMSLLKPADRCDIQVDNVDGVVGQALSSADGVLSKCMATVYRIYVNLNDPAEIYLITRLVGMFQTDAKAGDAYFDGVVLSDVYAAAPVSGDTEVKPTCTWRYKDPDTCTYSGGLPTCDLTLTGGNGCIVHHGASLALARFGGHGLFLDEQSKETFASEGGVDGNTHPDLRGPIRSGGGGGISEAGSIAGPFRWRYTL